MPGAIVPVRYDADHKHVVLDIPKLEAVQQAKKEAKAELAERSKHQAIAAADAELAKERKHPHLGCGREDQPAVGPGWWEALRVGGWTGLGWPPRRRC